MAGVQSVTYNSPSTSSGWSDGITIDESSTLNINHDDKNDKAEVKITQNNAKYIANDSANNKTDISSDDISKARQGGTTGDNRAKLVVSWAGDDVVYDDDASFKNGQDKIDTRGLDEKGSLAGSYTGAVGGGIVGAAAAPVGAAVGSVATTTVTTVTTVEGVEVEKEVTDAAPSAG